MARTLAAAISSSGEVCNTAAGVAGPSSPPDASASRERERDFLRWIDQVGRHGDGLHLVGDLIDFWFEWKHVVPKGAVRLLGRIGELTDGGLDVHWHLGNHDMRTRGYLADELGVHVHSDPLDIEYGGRRYLVGHGDGLGPGDRKYKALKRLFRNPAARWAFARLHPNFYSKSTEFTFSISLHFFKKLRRHVSRIRI